MNNLGVRLKAAENLKRRASKQKVKKIDVVNEGKLWHIAYWSGYTEALKDIKKLGA